MSHEDFDLERLADYLHLRTDQVSRMAERGKLPGRRIGGKWRFSTGEIHQWWEDQIGVLDEEELAQVESVLQPEPKSEASQFSLVDLLPANAIALSLEARTRNSVIAAMVNLASETGFLWDTGKMMEAVRARENLHPTALGNGVALLHPRRPLASILAEPFFVLGRTISGLRFDGGSRLTDIFFLICSRDDRGHLRVLARISRLVADPSFLSGLRDATAAQDVKTLIRDFESKLAD